MTNPAHIIETALLFLAAYLIGCTVGYALRRLLHAARGTRRVAPPPTVPVAPPEPRRSRSPAARLAASVEDLPLPVTKPVAAEPAEPAIVAPQPVPAAPLTQAKSSGSRPVALAEPRGGIPDNLKQIKGIGPKIEASLYALGIFHIDQIAGWSKAEADWVDAQLAFKGRIRRERWVEQAKGLSKAGAAA